MEIETEVRAGAETKMERKQKKQLTYMSDILVVNNLWTSWIISVSDIPVVRLMLICISSSCEIW